MMHPKLKDISKPPAHSTAARCISQEQTHQGIAGEPVMIGQAQAGPGMYNTPAIPNDPPPDQSSELQVLTAKDAHHSYNPTDPIQPTQCS